MLGGADVDLEGAAEALGNGRFADQGGEGLQPGAGDGNQLAGFTHGPGHGFEQVGGGEVVVVAD